MSQSGSDPNPYAVTTEHLESSAVGPQTDRGGQWVLTHLPIMCALQVATGVLELLYGLYFVAMFFFFLNSSIGDEIPQQTIFNVMAGYFIVSGVLVSLVGLCRVASGCLGFVFRGKVGLLIATYGGLFSLLGIYCFISAVPLAIYGGIVLSRPQVAEAFRMRRDGRTTTEIRRHFAARI